MEGEGGGRESFGVVGQHHSSGVASKLKESGGRPLDGVAGLRGLVVFPLELPDDFFFALVLPVADLPGRGTAAATVWASATSSLCSPPSIKFELAATASLGSAGCGAVLVCRVVLFSQFVRAVLGLSFSWLPVRSCICTVHVRVRSRHASVLVKLLVADGIRVRLNGLL